MNAKSAQTAAEDDRLHPRRAQDLLGHEQAENQLERAFRSGKLAHAWMITGPKGIGKATLAYRFARFILSEGAPGGGVQATGLFGDTPAAGLSVGIDHPVFQRVANGSHGDLVVVQRSLNEQGKLRTEIVVDDVRAINGFFSMTSAEGGWRVVIIDSADEMNRNAANAVLKVLEEPPPRTVLLLVTHSPGRLLPTIRSRCRKLALAPLSDDIVQALVDRHLNYYEPEERAGLVPLAEGSIGRAIELAEGRGLAIQADLLELLRKLPDLSVPAVHNFADALAKPGQEAQFSLAIELMGRLTQRLALEAAGGIGRSRAADPNEAALIERFGQPASLDRWLMLWEKINALGTATLSINLDRRQVVLNLILAIEAASRPVPA